MSIPIKDWTPERRARRAAYKRERVTVFMAMARFCTREAIAELLGCAPGKAHVCLTKLERLGVVRRSAPVFMAGAPRTLWIAPGPIKLPDPQFVNHALATRIMAAKALRAGWTDWKLDSRGEGSKAAYPDAIAALPDGRLVAIEIERHPRADYVPVIKARIEAGRGKWARLVYLCETPALAKTVRERIDAVFANKHEAAPDGSGGWRVTSVPRSWVEVFAFTGSWPRAAAHLSAASSAASLADRDSARRK